MLVYHRLSERKKLNPKIPSAPITKEIIKQFLPANPVIIEAGAHIGRDTLKMSKLWPESTVYAFEPVPELFEQLVERTKEQTNVHCFNIALSTQSGTATLNVSTGATTAASSLLEPYEYRVERPNVLFHPLTVDTITLDQWAQKNNVNRVDFLWLDMQGYELKVLEASPKIVSIVQLIVIEASLTERFKHNPLYEAVMNWMQTHNFEPLQQDIPKHNKINILFKRR